MRFPTSYHCITHPEGQLEGEPGLPAGAVLGGEDVVEVVGEEAVEDDVGGHHDEDAAEGDGAVRLPEVDVPLGVNSIDIMNFGHETGHKTGPSSGPNSVLGQYKFRYVSKLQT